jgi:hypothetical protein
MDRFDRVTTWLLICLPATTGVICYSLHKPVLYVPSFATAVFVAVGYARDRAREQPRPRR